MPGKINPVMPELILQVGYDIRWSAMTIEAACSGGELEVNVRMPVIARRLLESLEACRQRPCCLPIAASLALNGTKTRSGATSTVRAPAW
jgi:aspartate ammonia-lyase